MKKAIEYLLFESNVSNYQISQATGISQVVFSKYATGKSDIGRMTLDNAEKIYNYYKEWLDATEKRFGSVYFDGKEYVLLEEAFLNHHISADFTLVKHVHYAARAIDTSGNEYMVYWNPVDGWEKFEDESMCCDWDKPEAVEKI